MLIAQTIVWLLMLYFGIGILFALFFIFTGITWIDAATKQTTWIFRLLVFPGAMALWPILLPRVIADKTHPPIETNAHRRAVHEAQQ